MQAKNIRNSNEKRITANRANAQLSTGPSNTQNSRFNALKHGLTARETVLRGFSFCESKAEFRSLTDQFMHDLAPQNAAEAFLVQQMVQACWRLRRAAKAENALFLKQEREQLHSIASKHAEGIFSSAHELERMDNSHIQRMVDMIEVNIDNLGSDELDLSSYRKNKEFAGLDEPALKQKIRDMFELQIKFLKAIITVREERAMAEMEERMDEACIPPEAGFDSILRYRTSIQREFYTALHELMRIRGAPTVDIHLD